MRDTTSAGLVVLYGSPLLVALTMISYSRVALGTDQGRLLFPALAPSALLVAGGLSAWLPRGWSGRWAVGWIVLMGTAACAALAAGVLVPYAPPTPPGPAQLAAATPVAARFGDALTLVASRWEGQPPDRLTLFWRAEGTSRDDLRVAVRLLDRNGGSLWEWKRSPGSGRLSTDLWAEGQIVADTYRLPSHPLAAAHRIEVAIYPFAGGAWLAPASATQAGDSPYFTLAGLQP